MSTPDHEQSSTALAPSSQTGVIPVPGLKRRREDLRRASRFTREQLRLTFRQADHQLIVFSVLMRLPPFMIALSVLLMMAHQTGEVSLGAYAAGLVTLSASVTHRLYRRLSRTFGYRPVLLGATTLCIPIIAWLMIEIGRFSASGAGGSISGLMLASLVAGLSTAPLGSMMRLFWRGRFQGSTQRTNLIYSSALESILDVLALPTAAAIVGLVSILGGVQSSLFAVIILNLMGILFVLFNPGSLEPFTLDTPDVMNDPVILRRNSQHLGWLPMVGASFLGISIGATQTALVLRAVQADTLETVGIYLGIMGAAGALTCLFLVIFFRQFASWEGWLLIGGALVMASLTLSLPNSVVGTIMSLMFFGCSIGAALMCMDTLITRLSARGNIELAHSSTQSAYIGGLALGYVWAMMFTNLALQSAALLVPLLATTLFFITGHIFGFLWRRYHEERLHILQSNQR